MLTFGEMHALQAGLGNADTIVIYIAAVIAASLITAFVRVYRRIANRSSGSPPTK